MRKALSELYKKLGKSRVSSLLDFRSKFGG